MNKKTFLIFAASLMAPFLAHAACEDNMQAWMSSLHPERTMDTSIARCKAWPANPALTLAVLPMPVANGGPSHGVIDIETVVADSASGEIIAHLYQPSAVDADKRSSVELSLDTSPFPVAPASPAFGVRAKFEDTARKDLKGGIVLSLYVLDGRSLRRVLDRLPVAWAQGQWDGKCEGFFDATSRDIGVGPSDSSGFAALKIAQVTTRTVSREEKGECIGKEGPPKQSVFTIRYRDGAYEIPPALREG